MEARLEVNVANQPDDEHDEEDALEHGVQDLQGTRDMMRRMPWSMV